MQHIMHQTAAIPFLGVGLGYRRDIKEGIFASSNEIDFLEIITEHYLDNTRALEELEQLCTTFRVIPHGISLSIGSMAPLKREYLQAIKRVCTITHTPYYSEHLCMTGAPGIDIGHLAPLWFTEKALQHVIDKVSQVQDMLGLPLVLENVTYYFTIPGASMSQTEFFNRLVAATGCGILLDITNVYINSVNHDFDPTNFLEQMPLEHVVQVHLAGGYWHNGLLVDGHSEPVQEESWELYRNLLSRCQVKGTIFEHDRNYPAMELLLQQIRKARQIVTSSHWLGTDASPRKEGFR
jgi:uncharacterized protein (UPF0276 family)